MFTKPTLVLNENIMMKNIHRMIQKTEHAQVEFRPHFKTHQSKAIGRYFRDAGVHAITVSSVSMATYFAKSGWTDITIAFPVNILAHTELNELASTINLHVLAVAPETLIQLDEKLHHEVGIYIELDPLYGRSGVPMENFVLIDELIKVINSSKHLQLSGFYTHAGHSYKKKSVNEVNLLASNVLKELKKVKNKYDLPICFGDTPSCSVLTSFDPVNQLSPGNFVFYDWVQATIGSCQPADIAVAMYCPVVAKYEARNELLIHGGAVHFSKDYLLNDFGTPYYGVVAESLKNGWGKPLVNNVVSSLSQEHGIVSCDKDFFDSVEIGSVIPILPIHSCLTADLMASYKSLNGKILDHLSSEIK